jgi:hypothetical protein
MQHLSTDKPRRWQYLTFKEQNRIRNGLPLYPVKKEKPKKIKEEKLFNAQDWMKRLEQLKQQ